MQIQPKQGGTASGVGPHKSRGVQGEGGVAPSDRATSRPGPAGGDQLFISPEARQLQHIAGGGETTAGALDPGRLRDILDRLGAGYYDRADVRQRILSRIAGELGLEGGTAAE